MSNLQETLPDGQAVGGNYEILGVAGRGGMGVVYRARDRRLDRIVALKFLPGDLAVTPRDRERFLREARTASSLDHPHIGVIHAIEETAQGQGFIVMAYYDGQSLARRIADGPLAEAEAVKIALQMAQGLAEAHAHHIVHRDIKPSNVMLTSSGGVRIVDFGLAQVTTQQTATGSNTTGTINYMSPEQALQRTIDHRTDIWSLGVTLSEMLTGRNPFEREGISATLLSILNEPPQTAPGITPELQEIVYRALAKDENARYANAGELAADLERVLPLLPAEPPLASPGDSTMPYRGLAGIGHRTGRGGRSATAPFRKAVSAASQTALPQLRDAAARKSRFRLAIAGLSTLLVASVALLLITPLRERLAGILLSGSQKHIAVLPFENAGGDANDDPLVAGLIDSLSDRLSNLDAGTQSLWVVPGSQIRRLKIDDPAQALLKLGATLVVRGSLNKHGNLMQLHVQLIDARKQRQIGSAEMEDTSGNIASLEDQAVTRLARMMNLKLPASGTPAPSSTAPGAYESYLSALGYLQRYDKPGNLDRAISELRNSIALDPKFAVSYAQLGDALRMKSSLSKDPQYLKEAEADCRKSLTLNADQPIAYVVLGRLYAAREQGLALQEFEHALTLDAHNADAESGLGMVYQAMGRLPEAEAALQKAVALSPGDWARLDELATFYDNAGRYQEAIHTLEQAEQLTPDNTQVLVNLAADYTDTGDAKFLPVAESLLRKAIAISPSYAAYANLGNVESLEGHAAEAAEATEKALAINDKDYVVWTNLLSQYETLGQKEKAQAVRLRTIPLLETAIRTQPRDVAPQAMLAEMYAEQHDREKALMHIQSAIALNPRDQRDLESLAEAYELVGDGKQALAYIRMAMKSGLTLEQLNTDPQARQLAALVRAQP